MTRLSRLGLLAAVSLSFGCAAFQAGDFKARSSGDSNQESLACEGECEITTTIDENGSVIGWSLKTGKDGRGVWHTGQSANAELYVQLVEAGVEAAASGASPAP